MMHADKLPGKTLAESLGIEVPDDAPGGARIDTLVAEGAQRSTRGARIAQSIDYDGFHDVDGYGRSDA